MTEGWQIAARFLNGEINSLPRVEIELKRVFCDEYPTEIWQICQRINDLDPNELADQMQELSITIKNRIENYALAGEASVADVRMAGDGLEEEYEEEGDEDWLEEEYEQEDGIPRTQEQKDLCEWISRHYSGTARPPGFHIYFVRCMVSCSLFL